MSWNSFPPSKEVTDLRASHPLVQQQHATNASQLCGLSFYFTYADTEAE